MRALVLAVAGLAIVATALPLLRRDDWWVRSFDFPRLQVVALGMAALAGLLVLGLHGTVASVAAALLTVALLLQAWRILPYTPFYPKQVRDAPAADPPRTLSFLVANVLMKNRRAEELLSIIRSRDPDLVLLLEPDAWWEAQCRALEEDWPVIVRRPLDNRYGMLLYSRLPLVDPAIRYLMKDGIPSMHAQVRLRSGDLVCLHCVHPEPPSPTEAPDSTTRDAELLLVGREVRASGRVSIVAGDLNDVAWSYRTTLFQRISGLLDPRRGRGMYNTFHARVPFFRFPLDHVFHSDRFELGALERLEAFGSDHFPIYVELVYRPEEADRQERPTPRDGEWERAGEEIAEGIREGNRQQ
jgi:endonuclease/exonuclease/phosphatase (EEP) superfamily protein YafD